MIRIDCINCNERENCKKSVKLTFEDLLKNPNVIASKDCILREREHEKDKMEV
jgi:hypothetical protein